MSMIRALLICAAMLVLSGCAETGKIFGFERRAPDEFTVVRNQPLSMPPDATLRPPAPGETQQMRDLGANRARDALLTSAPEPAEQPVAGNPLATDPFATGPLAGDPLAPAQPATDPLATDPFAASQPGTDPLAPAPVAQAPTTPYTPPAGPSKGEVALVNRVASYYGVESDIRRKVDEETSQLALEQKGFLHTVLFWKDPPEPGTPLDASAESKRLRENEALGKPINSGVAPLIVRKKSGVSGLF